MTLGGAAQVAAAHCPNERTLDPAVCSYNRPTYAPASRTMAEHLVTVYIDYTNYAYVVILMQSTDVLYISIDFMLSVRT